LLIVLNVQQYGNQSLKKDITSRIFDDRKSLGPTLNIKFAPGPQISLCGPANINTVLLGITLKNPAFVFKTHLNRQTKDRSLLTSFPTKNNEY
jgi:hypothetical protein